MDVVLKCVNFIRSHALNHRQFKDFLESIECDYTDVPYHCEVRWLSRAKTLERFFNLREYISEFMLGTGKNIPELDDPTWVQDLAFLVDLTKHLNDLNLKLQGKDKLICDINDAVKAFKLMISLRKTQIENHNFTHFPYLRSLNARVDVQKYIAILSSVKDEFDNRFHDLEVLQLKLELFTMPYSAKPLDVPSSLQLELIDLQCNSELTKIYINKDISGFYKALERTRYPQFHRFAAEMIYIYIFQHLYLRTVFFPDEAK
ncbi:hypothetical protein ANN_10896 [Periplaneta americana]|uniref:Uncharacterized protein n=1 Tax=Periplaneta americana TaxID=6978 RepID=A0ABQ8T571_PERAM|nr:hypothetical protein ANN_10896 [Periplaneta americana]